jgi:beta-hydroxylase
MSLFITLVLLGYALCAVAYVFRWRGTTRYASLSQYLRKRWPSFAPLSCLMYLGTRPSARAPVLQADYLVGIQQLRENWQVLRNEALALHSEGVTEATKAPGPAGYYDVGFRTFYKRGWSKFYLTWYGVTHPSAQRLCPKTIELLERVPGIRGAMFSILAPGAELTLHVAPMPCSLGYHLGLATPNAEGCFLNVDGTSRAWKDGEDFVFDETYPHHAHNASTQHRLIFMADVDRPMNAFGRLVNRLFLPMARTTLVPSTKVDPRGLLSALFVCLAPLRGRALLVRTKRRWL